MVRMLLNLTQALFVLCLITSCKNTEGNAPDIITSPIINSSSVVASNKTATSFTLTWDAAVDDATVSGNLMYKLVYSTTNNISDAISAEANGVVALNWTANVVTANLSSLSNSTTYYLALLVKDADDNISIVNTDVITMCTGKRMFLVTAPNGAFGGKTGGDALCNSVQKPAGIGSSKAMISDNTGVNPTTGQPSASGRQACYGNCRSSNLYIWDWVFAAGQRYCNSDYSKRVGDAGASYPVLYTADTTALSATPVSFYAGFHMQFGNSTTNCNNWSSTVNSYVAGSTGGALTASDSSFILGGGSFPSCTTAASIVCVEQ